MQVIIDRFEGEYAIVELDVGTFVNVPKVLVPKAKEGDVIDITINREETKKRRQTVENLMDELFH